MNFSTNRPLLGRGVRVCLATALLSLGIGLGAGQQTGANPPPPGLSMANPAVAAVARLQDRHTPSLLEIPGVVGTATGLDASGNLAITVFTEAPGVGGVPSSIEGVPVAVEVSGIFHALFDTTASYRPPPVGVSIGHPEITAGTLGCWVRDRDPEQSDFFILSNNHVLANANDASQDDPILQPGPFDGGSLSDVIGRLHRWELLRFDGSPNFMDAAIAWIDPTRAFPVPDTSPPLFYWATHPEAGGYGVPNSTTLPATFGLAVQKFGRTTGQTHGQITELNVTVEVCYESAYRGPLLRCIKSAVFTGQILIGGGTFSAGGDSGSLIVTDDGYNNPVALLFAGSDAYTIATPIDVVLDHFGVVVDDGMKTTIKGTISGKVVDVAGTPLAGATVILDDTGHYTQALEDGSYTLQYVPEGTRSLTAAAPGYENGSQTGIVVIGGEPPPTTPNINFLLQPVPGGIVRGRITDVSTAAGIVGATVTVEETGQSTLTEEDGVYQFDNVPAGTYTLAVSAAGYASASQSITVMVGDIAKVDFALSQAIVIPSGFADVEAAGWGGTFWSPLRLQEVYSASHFNNKPVLIEAIAFRLEGGVGTSSASALAENTSSTNAPSVKFSPPTPGTPSEAMGTVVVRLSTTDAVPDALNREFAVNAGLDETVVYSGALTVNASGTGSQPNPFEILIVFAEPFVYQPAQGNLLVDISNYGIEGIQIDGANGTDDAASRIWSSDPYAALADKGMVDTGADVIRLSVSEIAVDSPPAVALTSPTDGSTISGTIVILADANDDVGVSRVDFFVDSALISTDSNGTDGWAASWDSTQAGDGHHTIFAEATDTAGQTASDQVAVVVENIDDAPSIHVGDLDGTATSVSRNWAATVRITIHDATEALVAGATVMGTWSGGYSGDAQAVTSLDGTVAITTPTISKKVASVEFTVTGVTHSGFSFDPTANHDPDGDSNGTRIIVSKP